MAGLFKLMDPVGTSLIVTEYLKFIDISFMIPVALSLGEVLAFCETVVGAIVLSGIWGKVAAFFSAIFMLFFTVLTIVLCIANPEMDCGCFGDALHLTHFQSLLKNIVLDILWVIAFIPFTKSIPLTKIKWAYFSFSFFIIAIFALYCAVTIPPIDFTPMAPGNTLYQAEYENKDAPILSFCNRDGEYADSLATQGRVMVISIYSPQKLKSSNWEKIDDLIHIATSEDFNVILLTTEFQSQIDLISIKRTYLADRKTLMTLNRSNGGVTYISDGIIVNKWAKCRYPSESILKKLYISNSTNVTKLTKAQAYICTYGFILIMLGLLVAIPYIEPRKNTRREHIENI